MKGEDALDAFSVGDLADGECGVDAAAAFCDDEACEDLDALFAAFDNAAVNFYGVTDVGADDVFLELLLFDFLDDVHGGVVAERCGWRGAVVLPDARGEMASGRALVLQGKMMDLVMKC